LPITTHYKGSDCLGRRRRRWISVIGRLIAATGPISHAGNRDPLNLQQGRSVVTLQLVTLA